MLKNEVCVGKERTEGADEGRDDRFELELGRRDGENVGLLSARGQRLMHPMMSTVRRAGGDLMVDTQITIVRRKIKRLWRITVFK